MADVARAYVERIISQNTWGRGRMVVPKNFPAEDLGEVAVDLRSVMHKESDHKQLPDAG